MARVSLDQRLDRELALAKPSVRFCDMGLQLRRLTVEPVPGDRLHAWMNLWSADGTAWRIPAQSMDNRHPISTLETRQAAAYSDGELLFASPPVGAASAATAVGVLRVETIINAGGIWDHRAGDWRRDERGERLPAAAPVLVQVRESQVEFTRWFAGCFERMRRGLPQEQQGALAFGATRSGKTVIALLCLVALAVDMPRVKGKQTVVILVSVNHPSRTELDRELRDVVPDAWRTYREQATPTSPSHTYTLANGAQLTHKTSEDPDELRSAGMITAALLNEAGRMPELAFRNVLNKCKDQDGIALLASNRPQRAKANYVALLAKDSLADAVAGKLPDFGFFKLDPNLNDAISAGASDRIGRILNRLNPDVDELESAIMEVGDFVYADAFDESVNIAPFPQTLPDITRIVTKMILGHERDWLLTADFQKRRGICGVSFKVLGSLPDKWVLWATRAFVIDDDGNEDDLIDDFEGAGCTAQNSIVIADASAAWQNYSHKPGLDSFRYFRDRRYVIRGAQPKKTKEAAYGCNPRPKEVAVSRVKELLKEPRPNRLRALMISDDAEAKPLAIDLKKCKAVKGKYGPIPGGLHADLPDCALYAVWSVLLALRPGQVKQRQAMTAAPATVTKFNR